MKQHTPTHRVTSPQNMPPQVPCSANASVAPERAFSIDTKAVQPADLLFSALQKTAHYLRVCRHHKMHWQSPSFCPLSQIVRFLGMKMFCACVYVCRHAFLLYVQSPLNLAAFHLVVMHVTPLLSFVFFFFSRKAPIRMIKAEIIQLCGNTGALSILSGTSKHTARHCTIRVHGWDGNILQYLLCWNPWRGFHNKEQTSLSHLSPLRIVINLTFDVVKQQGGGRDEGAAGGAARGCKDLVIHCFECQANEANWIESHRILKLYCGEWHSVQAQCTTAHC